MHIALGFPYDSKFMYKLAYVIKNSGESNSKSKLLVVPYLHEQKIYTHNRHKNINYFIT